MPWPTKKLGEVLEYEQPTKYLVSSTDYRDEYAIPVLTAGKSFLLGNTNEKNGIFPKDKLPVIIFDDFTTAIKFVDFPFKVKSSAMKILHAKKNEADIRFLFYKMLTIKFAHNQHKRYWISECSNIKIPLPPLAIQKQIVERLDKIAEAQKLNNDLIQKSDELFQSLLHQELNPVGKDWEIKKLGDIIKPQYGYTASAKDSGNYRFIRITDIGDEGELRDSDKKYVMLGQNEAENYRLRNGDLLLARTGATFGKILYFTEDEPAIFASFLIRLNPDFSIDPFYIWLFSRSQSYWRQAKSLMTGSGQPQFNANKLKQIKIAVPPLKTQKQIVAKLSAVQEYKTQLLAQKSKLKELFNSALAKSFSEKI